MSSRWRLRWPWYRRTRCGDNEAILDVLGIDYKHQDIRKATIVLEATEAPMVTLDVYLGDRVATERREFRLVPKSKLGVTQGRGQKVAS